MSFKILGVVILVFGHFTMSSAQSCQGFHKISRCAERHSSDFKQYGQAKSAAIIVGQKYKSQVVFYGEKDYIVSVCTEVDYKDIHFTIYDKTNNQLIYDNAEDNYNNGVGFSVEKTSNMEIEVEVLYEKEGDVDPDDYRVCMGIQILWRKIPRMGFGE